MKSCCNHDDCSGPPRKLGEEAHQAIEGKRLADLLLEDGSISGETHSLILQILRDSLV